MIGPRRSELKRVVIVVTGASGVVLAIRLVEVLRERDVETLCVVTGRALVVADHECVSREWFLGVLSKFCTKVYREGDWESPLASSSFDIDACIAVPLTVTSAAKLSLGIYDNLALRALGNCIRLGRPVVAVVRECPLGVAELRALLRLAEMGVRIVPAVVGFYAKPASIKDVVDFIVGKVLDVLGIENDLYARWGSEDSSRAQTLDPCRALYG